MTSSSKQKRDSAGAQVRRYMASQPAKQRTALRTVRAAIRATAPKAVEHFSYGIPGFRLEGRPLVWYGAFRQHVSLYPVTAAIQRPLADDIEGIRNVEGDHPLPARGADAAGSHQEDREGWRAARSGEDGEKVGGFG